MSSKRLGVVLSVSAIAALLTGLLLVAMISAAPLQPDVGLENVDASFWGEGADDWAGWSVASAGDVNGDGYDDFLIGAPQPAPDVEEFSTGVGKTYLILGRPTVSWTTDVTLAGHVDASFLGESEDDRAGHSAAGVGDVDADGFDDFIIGARFNDEGGERSGKVYLVRGEPREQWSMNTSLAQADASFVGEDADDRAGHSVAGVGDVNGDGYSDFLIGAPFRGQSGRKTGETYLILGRDSGDWATGVDLSNADASFRGHVEQGWSGYAVAGTGDVNGDGCDDFLIAAPGGKEEGVISEIYLILGRDSPWEMHTDLSSRADGILFADNPAEYCGWGLSGAGDVNGDSYDDILIGCWGNDDVLTNTGKTYLILGRPTGDWTKSMTLSQYADASFLGEVDPERQGHEWSGFAVSGVGDTNGDGYDDFLIGSYGNDEPFADSDRNSGQVYLLLGRPAADWGMDFDLGNADASYWGEASIARAGMAVAGAGDVNGDGRDDFLIGAPRQRPEGAVSDVGKAYLILGRGFELAKTVTHSEALPNDILTYTLDYYNTGGINARDVIITDTVPPYTTYSGCEGGESCGEEEGVVKWMLGDVLTETSGVATLVVRVNSSLCEDVTVTNVAHLWAANLPDPIDAAVRSRVIVTPTAEFVSSSPVCLGTTMTFTDTSMCAISWSWDFGDSSGTSDARHPSYLYATPGTYAVALTVTNGSGRSDSYEVPVLVEAYPTADFTSNSPVYLRQTVHFTNTSTGGETYVWDFDDGEGSPAVSPMHEYAAAGTYTVVVIATSGSGCTDIYSDTVVVNALPTAGFTLNSPVCVGETVVLTNTSSDADIYQWDFGDGESSTAEEPRHDYAAAGTYQVVLTATNLGGFDVYSDRVTVNALPVAGFTYHVDGLTVTFSNASANAIGYWWDFGDGIGMSTDADPTYAYEAPGEYTVTLTATSIYGCSAVYQTTVEVDYHTIYLPMVVRNGTPVTRSRSTRPQVGTGDHASTS